MKTNREIFLTGNSSQKYPFFNRDYFYMTSSLFHFMVFAPCKAMNPSTCLCKSPDTQGLKATSRCGLQLFFPEAVATYSYGWNRVTPFTVHTGIGLGIISLKPGRFKLLMSWPCFRCPCVWQELHTDELFFKIQIVLAFAGNMSWALYLKPQTNKLNLWEMGTKTVFVSPLVQVVIIHFSRSKHRSTSTSCQCPITGWILKANTTLYWEWLSATCMLYKEQTIREFSWGLHMPPAFLPLLNHMNMYSV